MFQKFCVEKIVFVKLFLRCLKNFKFKYFFSWKFNIFFIILEICKIILQIEISLSIFLKILKINLNQCLHILFDKMDRGLTIFHAIFIYCFFKLLLNEIFLSIAYSLSLIQFYDVLLSELFHGRRISFFRSFLFMKLQYSPLLRIVSISSAKRNVHTLTKKST